MKRKTAETFPPSSFIREEMEARGWSAKTLAINHRLNCKKLKSFSQDIAGLHHFMHDV